MVQGRAASIVQSINLNLCNPTQLIDYDRMALVGRHVQRRQSLQQHPFANTACALPRPDHLNCDTYADRTAMKLAVGMQMLCGHGS